MDAILALDSANGLSKDGIIPWQSKIDMQHFYNITKGNIVVMGKNTYFSLPAKNRPLKNRLNVILTNNPDAYQPHHNAIFSTTKNLYENIIEDSINYESLLNKYFKVIIIGGKQIYEKYLPECKNIWLTRIKKNYECDLTFEYNFSGYTSSILHDDDELRITKYTR